MHVSYMTLEKQIIFFKQKVNPKLKKKKTPQIPHGFLKCYYFIKKAFLQDNPQYNSEDFNILLTAIYYHHNRKDIYKADEIKTLL